MRYSGTDSPILSNYKLLTVNCYFPGGPIPQNMAKTFDGPPTLERSGSERRGGAVSSLFPEGERVGVRGGAFLKGKEGRVGFRKNSLWLKILQMSAMKVCFQIAECR